MRKFYRSLSPGAQYVIAETAKVCVCVAAIIFVGEVVLKGASVALIRD